MSDVEVLTRTKILQGLSLDQLKALLMTSQIVTYQQDQLVFQENTHGREMYVVLAGAVAVKVDPARLGTVEKGSTELRTILTFGPGESFGELEVLDKHAREATVVSTQPNTRLMLIPFTIFENVVQAQIILSNLAQDLSEKIRGSNKRLIEIMLAGYYLTALVDELATGTYECSPITPLERVVVVREAENFILSGPGYLLPAIPEKEAVELYFFAEPLVLQKLAAPGAPSGAIIFSALFSILKSGHLSHRIDSTPFQYQIRADTQRRAGTLWVEKVSGGRLQRFTLEWEVKGAYYNHAEEVTDAKLFLNVHTDEASSRQARAKEIIETIDMPVQRSMCQTLPQDGVDKAGFRVFVIHHRTHETARSLHTIRDLGYEIDTFIGIPYGDVNWETIIMLDHAAGHNYLSLKLINHATEPIQYEFDFRQSSFLKTSAERDLLALYADPAVRGDYLTAMQALAEYRLNTALLACRQHGQRLLVYEDGGYVVTKIYEINKNPTHAMHALVKQALADGTIVGVVEVTVAGERKNLQLIKENNGQPLLPVLSNARSDIKAVFEAMGVAEAVICASSTSLGRLGLPTFQTRRVAIIGGNGAIGTRLIEHFTTLHNSTTNVFAVDISDHAFSMELDNQKLPYAATRLKYHALPRYVVSDDCLPKILDAPYNQPNRRPDQTAIAQAIHAFLAGNGPYHELALSNAYPLKAAELEQLWAEVEQRSGYALAKMTPLERNLGARYSVQKGEGLAIITLLANPVVLTFKSVSRLLRNGVNTVAGSTGYPVFSAKNLDDFFARPNAPGQVDDLTLISASSKDYEFRRAIDLLNILLKLEVKAPVPAPQQLAWFADLYKDEMSFLSGDDFIPLQSLLAAPITPDSIQNFMGVAPLVAQASGLFAAAPDRQLEVLADYLAQKIRRRVTIRKEIRPDIGSIYHLTVSGRTKRVILLAEGLVVNFYARHEKGVKTEFIDSIVTMQVLSLIKLSTTRIEPGLYNMDTQLRPEDMMTFWSAIDDKCRPLQLN